MNTRDITAEYRLAHWVKNQEVATQLRQRDIEVIQVKPLMRID